MRITYFFTLPTILLELLLCICLVFVAWHHGRLRISLLRRSIITVLRVRGVTQILTVLYLPLYCIYLSLENFFTFVLCFFHFRSSLLMYRYLFFHLTSLLCTMRTFYYLLCIMYYLLQNFFTVVLGSFYFRQYSAFVLVLVFHLRPSLLCTLFISSI